MAALRYKGSHPLAAHEAVVLYDPGDGRIIHVHHVVVIEGGHRPSDEERLRHEFAAAGVERHAAEVLHVDGALFEPGCTHRVDTATGSLVSEPVPERPRRR